MTERGAQFAGVELESGLRDSVAAAPVAESGSMTTTGRHGEIMAILILPHLGQRWLPRLALST